MATADTTSERSSLPPDYVGEHRPWVTNLVLLIMVLSLGIWVWLGEEQIKSDAEIKAQERNVFKYFQPFDAKGIVIQRRGETLSFTRDVMDEEAEREEAAKGGFRGPTGWKMQKPVQDLADDTQLLRLLNAMQHLKYSAKIEGDDLDAYTFGDAAVCKGWIHRKDKPIIAFEVGLKRGTVYPIRFVGKDADKTIYHVTHEFVDQLLQRTETFRDKKLFRSSPDAVRIVDLFTWPEQRTPTTRPDKRITLTRGAFHWRVGAADGDYAIKQRTADLLQTASSLVAVGIEKDGATPGDLTRFGLMPPRFALNLTDTNKQVRILEIGNFVPERTAERYARVSGRRAIVYRVNLTRLREFFGDDPADYLETRLFPIPSPQAVKSFGVKVKDGPTFLAKQEDGAWKLDGDALAATPATMTLIRQLTELSAKMRLDDVDEEEEGLEKPAFTVQMQTDETKYLIHIGREVPGEDGDFVVKKVLPNEVGQPPSVFYSRVPLNDLPLDLKRAHLDLLERTILKAGFAERIELLDPDGKPLFQARKVGDPNNPRIPKQWEIKGKDTAAEEIQSFVDTHLHDMEATWELRTATTDLKAHGLDRPRKFVVWLPEFEDGKPVEGGVPHTLLLGKRAPDDPNYAYVMREGAPVIGLIDATFLDLMLRGFEPQYDLGIDIDEVFDVRGIVVRRDGRSVLAIIRPTIQWMREPDDRASGRTFVGGRNRKEQDDLEDMIRAGFVLTPIKVRKAEDATPQRLKETGLAEPRWEIIFRVQDPENEKKIVEHTLFIGDRAGGRDVWATTPGNPKLGKMFDEPLRRVKRFMEEWPGLAPFPPRKKRGG